MSEEEKKGPTRYQAKVWSDTTLEAILSGVLFNFKGCIYHSHAILDNARQIGCYFPEFSDAFETWIKIPVQVNEIILKEKAEKVFLSLPTPFDHPDVCFELDAAEEKIRELVREREALIKKNAALEDELSSIKKRIREVQEEELRDFDILPEKT